MNNGIAPEFVTVNAAVKLSPSGRLRGMESTAEIADGVWTLTAVEVAGAEATGLPSVASVPLALELNVTVPGALPV